jgi:hypothetical protein
MEQIAFLHGLMIMFQAKGLNETAEYLRLQVEELKKGL